MSRPQCSWVPAEFCAVWKNLHICRVENASTLWVREVHSSSMSNELILFHQMEKQMNIHFKEKSPDCSLLQFPANVKDTVVVHHEGHWFRGLVESITNNKERKLHIFLLDYGVTVEAHGCSIYRLSAGEWMSVPYQAKRVQVFGVVPVSLHYSLSALDLKLKLKTSSVWDPAANDFVENIFRLQPYTEFIPVLFGPDGCFQGSLSVQLSGQFWDVIKELSPLSHLRPQEGAVTMDIAKILVDCDFASWNANLTEERLKGEEREKDSTIRTTEKNCLVSSEGGGRQDNFIKKTSAYKLHGKNGSSQSPCDAVFLPEHTIASDKADFIEDGKKPQSAGRGLMMLLNTSLKESLSRVSSVGCSSLLNGSFVARSNNNCTSSFSPSHLSSEKSLSSVSTNDQHISSLYGLEAIPAPVYEGERLISRLVSAPQNGNVVSDLENEKLSEVVETRRDVNDNSHNKSKNAASGERDNNTDNIHFNSPFAGLTSSAKSPNLKDDLFSSICECVGKMSTKYSLRNPSPKSPGQGLCVKEEDSLETFDFWLDSPDWQVLSLQSKGEHIEKDKNYATGKITESKQRAVKSDCKSLAIKSAHVKERVELTHLSQSSEVVGDALVSGTKTKDDMKEANKKETDIPHWVSARLMATLQNSHHIRHKELGISVEDISSISERSENQAYRHTYSKQKPLYNSTEMSIFSGSSVVCTDSSHNTEEIKRIGMQETHCQNENSKETQNKEVDKEHQMLDTSFMSDIQDVCTSEFADKLEEKEFSQMKESPTLDTLNIAKLFRVFVAGDSPLVNEDILVNESMMTAILNCHIVRVLNYEDMRPTRLQAYTWPVIARGSSAVIIGGRSSGKTLGYIVPLISTILDTWKHISHRLAPGIGAAMVVVCHNWQSVKLAAQYIVSLLPAGSSLKVRTAWGGRGHNQAKIIKIQLVGGCDILVTTAPCLIRLLTGTSVTEARERGSESDTPVTSLARCCHLVIDDADSILEYFAADIKQLLILWAKGRKEHGRKDLEQQIVLVGSRWTPLFGSLTHTLMSTVGPTIIISSPSEAAICTRVVSHLHLVLDEEDSLQEVVELVQNLYNLKKNLVFVSSDIVGEKLKAMLEAAAIYSVNIPSSIIMWNLRNLVHLWHKTQAITMIVCRGVEHHLFKQDLANADNIFHTYISTPVSRFFYRYSFMIEKFSIDLKQNSPNCESHVFVTKETLQSVPNLLNELKRLCDHIPDEVIIAASLTDIDKFSFFNSLCYYLKAYGRCPVLDNCGFRHKIQLTDSPQHLPRMGEVTFDIVKVLNASRYLVRLTEYREKAGTPSLDLRNHYPSLFLALQLYFANPENSIQLEQVEPGMLCAVKDKGRWARARVIRIDYTGDIPELIVFLVDEGIEFNIDLKAAFSLPPYLAALPEIIVEVYLCCVQPVDFDREWTIEASQYVQDFFSSNNYRKFVGQITLALGQTLWLSPLVEVVQIGKTFVQRGPLRGKLITQGFGINNPTHLEVLKLLCFNANISLDPQDLNSSDWKINLKQTFDRFHSLQSKEDLNNKTLKHSNGASVSNRDTSLNVETGEIIDELVCTTDTTAPSEDDKFYTLPNKNMKMEQVEEYKVDQNTFKFLVSDNSTINLAQEDLPLNVELRVELGEIISPECFFILREDKYKKLHNLEIELDTLAKLETSDGVHTEDLQKNKDVSTASCCIARFSDGLYYRGRVESSDCDGSKNIFFVDHGERLKIPTNQIFACPSTFVEVLPAQAIPCRLAYVTILSNMKDKAKDLMSHLTYTTAVWTVKAVDVQDTVDGKIYSVDLTDASANPPKKMWQELVHAGVAVTMEQMEETEHERFPSINSFDVSCIEDKEATDFLLSVPAVKALIEEDRHALKILGKVPITGEETSASLHHTGNSSVTLHHTISSVTLHQTDISDATEKLDLKNSLVTNDGNQKGRQYKENLLKVKKAGSLELCNMERSGAEKSPLNVVQQTKNCRASQMASSAFREKCLNVPPLEAVEGITAKLFPDTSWSQDEDSVSVTLHLVGVEAYKCRLGSSRLTFMTVIGDNFYVIDEELREDIDPNHSTVIIKGTCVSINLMKATKGRWGSLLAEGKRWPCLRVDYQPLLSDDDEESSPGESEGDWYDAVGSISAWEYGGLPAGISESDSSCDQQSDDEFLMI